MIRNIKLVVEYDGSDFSGWQIQPSQRTVQGTMEKALAGLTRQPIRINASGRTDAGVHAMGQVVNFHYRGNLELPVFVKGMNAVLPPDIRIHSAETVSAGFDARRSAHKRTYRYVISRSERAIGRQYAWFPPFTYELSSMETAARHLTGTHLWEAFAKKTAEKESLLSTVYCVNWQSLENEIRFEITAIRFFHSMIRLIMGTLMEVGRGALCPDDMKTILDSRDLSQAGMKAPACGLYLLHVDYGEE